MLMGLQGESKYYLHTAGGVGGGDKDQRRLN